MEMVVCNHYQLARLVGNQFEKDHNKATLVAENVVIPRSYADQCNGQWSNSGKLYVIDEKKSKEFSEYIKNVRQERESIDKALLEGSAALTNVLASHNKALQKKSTLAKGIEAVKDTLGLGDKE